MIRLEFKRIPHNIDLPLPAFETPNSAGMDVRAAVEEPMIMKSSEWVLVPTGLKMAIPEGYEVQVRPRSGLAFKHGVTVLNAPGTIDADYRGELKILLINNGKDDFLIQRGDRIAQLIVAKIHQPEVIEVQELSSTQRGEGGFGSTGVK